MPPPPPLNVAVTDRAWLMETVQVAPLLPVQPLQLPKVEPLAGDAVRVTVEVLEKLALHVVPQLMPDGLEVTVPVPAPARVTVSVLVVPPPPPMAG